MKNFISISKSIVKFLITPFIQYLENRKKTFIFQSKKYCYFYNRRNYTFINERAIEIPIFNRIVNKYKIGKILEVGSTLWNYFHQDYHIVDKYDHSTGIINMDILSYKPKFKYDLIISISTLEHVGWNENLYSAKKSKNNNDCFFKTIKHLESLLSNKGVLIFSVPLGYNPFVDLSLTKNFKYFTELHFMQRSYFKNQWKQVKYKHIKNLKHNHILSYSNAIVVGVINKNISYSNKSIF
ncbi:MAG: hypothetical protein QMD92_00480 [bacterium]|nr:hypothetical protein [bacterium]